MEDIKLVVHADGRMTRANSDATIVTEEPETDVVNEIMPNTIGTEFFGAAGPVGPGLSRDFFGEYSQLGTHSTLWISRDETFDDKSLVYCFNLAKVAPADPKSEEPTEPKTEEPVEPKVEEPQPKAEQPQPKVEKKSDVVAEHPAPKQETKSLPNTGASVVTWAGIGALLLLAGTLFVARRRA